MAQLPIVRAALVCLFLLLAAQPLAAQSAPDLDCPECQSAREALTALLEQRRRTRAELSKADLAALEDRILDASGALTECRLKCIGLRRATAADPAATTTSGAAPGAPVVPWATAVKCPECQHLDDLLKEIDKHRQEKLERLGEVETLLKLASIDLASVSDPAKVKELKNEEALLRNTLVLQDSLTRGAQEDLRGCNKLCEAPNMLANPFFYVPLGGALIGGSAILIGGGGSPATGSTAPAVPAPTTTTAPPAPAPAPTPAPTTPVGLNPTGRHNIPDCVCAIDDANFNAVLQFCTRVSQLTITASPSAGTIVVAGPAPLSSMSGVYNTTSGEFDLQSVVLVNGAAVQVRFRGTITAAGSIANATLTFNQTVYRFSTVNVGP